MQSIDPENKSVIDDSNTELNTDSSVHDTSMADDARRKEIGGRGGPDPARYGDWEKAGRCIDF